MLNSSSLSYAFLRFGVAAVFLVLGIDKFFHPVYWTETWLPIWITNFIGHLGIQGIQLIYFLGILEVATGLSFVLGIFTKFFAIISSIFIVLIILIVGLNKVTIRDLAVLGGVLSILFWPQRQNGY